MTDFQVPERTHTITFDDGPLQGAEIVVDASVRAFTLTAIRQWMGQLASAETGDARLNAVIEMAGLFAPHLRSWNLVGPKGPMPPTLETLRDMDFELLTDIVTRWGTGGTVPFPLPVTPLPGPAKTAGPRKRSTGCTRGSSSSASSRRKSTRSRTPTA